MGKKSSKLQGHRALIQHPEDGLVKGMARLKASNLFTSSTWVLHPHLHPHVTPPSSKALLLFSPRGFFVCSHFFYQPRLPLLSTYPIYAHFAIVTPFRHGTIPYTVVRETFDSKKKQKQKQRLSLRFKEKWEECVGFEKIWCLAWMQCT